MNTLEFSDIDIERIAQSFEAAAISFKTDEEDSELYLTDGIDFPFWLKIDEKKKRIKFYTYLKAKDGTSPENLKEFAHELNDQYVTVRFTISVDEEDGRVYLFGDYFLYTGFGIIVPQLIHTAKKFAKIFIDAVREEDQGDVFF